MKPAPNILICGDFNLPNTSWDGGNIISNGSQSQKCLFDCLSDFMNTHFLSQYISHSTHKGGNTLDLVFANNASLLHSYKCIVPSMSSVSDHHMVECKTLLGATEESVNERPPKASALDNLNFFSNGIEREVISVQFEGINWSQVLEGRSPHDQLNLVMGR